MARNIWIGTNMVAPKKSPITKALGAGAKAVARTVTGSNKDVKTNKAINKTLEKTFGAKTISKGKAKAAGLPKGSNKATAKKIAMSSPFKDSIQKHPLVRNTGEASAEGKYRANRGRPVPVKRKAK